MKKKRPTKEQLETFTRAELKDEMVKTLTDSMMQLIQTCVEKRISQWFDVIVRKLEEDKIKP